MAKIAVIFSVIFSLFLLSHARIPSNLLPTEASSLDEPVSLPAVEASSFEEADLKTIHLQPEERSDDAIRAIGITRPMPYGFRLLPINRHFHHTHVMRRPFVPRRGCRHAKIRTSDAKPTVMEIPYGDDMVGFPGRHQIPTRKRMMPWKTAVFGRDGMIEVDGHQVSDGARGFPGEMRAFKDWNEVGHGHGHKEEIMEMKEEGGFGKLLQDFLNRF